MQLKGWIEACTVNDIEQEDVIRFDYENRTFAIYRSQDNGYYATDGFCTHEKVHLANGLVIGHLIECPKHNGRFDYTTGQASRKPACEQLTTYPVQVVTDKVYIQIN
ncbi:MocE family 2Fe-2S type ferredoxin [Paenibacillus sp. 2RAB27]|uniref:MocE family 2Fe-2S type ferredoxin n=1 Tax=Paenibacillus sp. 2RAB27 TaxID=3232991 RepID=UPI003F9B031C